jgi:hypothetical protein
VSPLQPLRPLRSLLEARSVGEPAVHRHCRDVLDAVCCRLGRIAADAGLVACGVNCMGFLNLVRSLRACAYAQPAGLRAALTPGGGP